MEVKMVETSSIISMAISFVLGVIFPIVLAFILHKKLRFTWKSILIGILVCFSVFILAFSWDQLSKNVWYVEFSHKRFFLYVFLEALSAGLFEEIGRYIGFSFFLKNHLTWENGIGYGIGHGGFESISKGTGFLIGLIYAIVLNANRTMPGLTSLMIRKLIETPSYGFLISGIGIVIAFIGQIALSLIVLYAVKKRKISFLFLTILLHTTVDFINMASNKLSIRGFVFCFDTITSIALVVWIFKSKKYLESNSNPNESTIESL